MPSSMICDEQVLLRGVVVVHARDRQAGPAGDAADRRRVVADLDEGLEGGAQHGRVEDRPVRTANRVPARPRA